MSPPNAVRLLTSAVVLASLLSACIAHQADRVPFDPAKVGKKPDAWKCYEAKIPNETGVRSYCFADGGECEESRSKFQASYPEAARVSMCGLESKAFCFQWAHTPDSALRDCAKTNEECELQAKSKASNAPLYVKAVSSCAAL